MGSVGTPEILLILIIALAARAVAFRGFSASDDADYARVAYDVAQGVFPPSDAGVPLRTAERWLTAYLSRGAAGLRRAGRADKGRHRLPEELLEVIEGMALRRPPPHALHRSKTSSTRRREVIG